MRKALTGIVVLAAVAVATWAIMPNGPVGKPVVRVLKERKQEIRAEFSGAEPPGGTKAQWSANFALTSKTGKPRKFKWWVELYNKKGLVAKPFEGVFEVRFPENGGETRVVFAASRRVDRLWVGLPGELREYRSTHRGTFPLDVWVGTNGSGMEPNEHYIMAMGFAGPEGATTPPDGFVPNPANVLGAANANDWVYVLRCAYEN